MRVCFLSNANSVHLKEWAEFFAQELGHEVTVLTIPPAQYRYAGVEVVDVGNRLSAQKPAWLATIPTIRRELDHRRADLLVAYRAVSYGFLAALIGFRPLVIAAQGGNLLSHRNTSWPATFAAWCARFAIRHADMFNAWSVNIRDELIRYGADPRAILTCSRGIDLRLHPDLPQKSPGPLRIVVTRSLSPTYNVAQLVRAMPAILTEERDARCDVLGDGPEREALRTLASDLGVAHAIRFRAHVEREVTVSVLREAHVYVSTTRTDGLPLSHFEAMAAGAFPICTDIAANAPWIEHGVNGYLVRVGDAAALARCVVDAYRGHRLRARAVQQNRRLVESTFDRSVNLARIADAYERLIASASPEYGRSGLR